MFNSCRSDQFNTANTQVCELAYFLFMLSYPLGCPLRYYRVDKLREWCVKWTGYLPALFYFVKANLCKFGRQFILLSERKKLPFVE